MKEDLKCVVCGGELKEEETNICDYTCKDCDCMQNANGIVFSDLPFYLANYDTDKNIEIFQDFDEAKKESINGKVYKATLNHTNVWFEDGKWNYEDDSFLFADEPLEVMPEKNIEIFAKVEYVQNVVITNIKWDTDNESVDLPKFVNMSIPMSIFDGEDNEYIASEYMSEKLSDDYGFCHCGFDDNFDANSFFENSFQDYMYENGNYVPEGARIGIEHNGDFVLDKDIFYADVPRSAYLESKNQDQTGKCVYCEDSKQTKDLHFACEICGNGICESCMTKVMTNGKIAFIKEDLEKLVGTRWIDKEELQKHLDKTYEINSNLKNLDKTGLLTDYAFTGVITNTHGSIDINYLKIPYGDNTIYITKVSVYEE